MTIETETGDDFDGDDGASAFFSNLTGVEDEGKKKTDAEDGASTEETEEAFRTTKETPEAETDAETPDATSDDPDEADLEWGDEGAKTKAKLKDLKDAYRVREESTRLSTEAAQARTLATTQSTQATTALNALVTKAAAKWEPFAKLDFLALSKDPSISSEDFTALRAAAQEALTDYRYLTTELEGTTKAATEAAQAARSSEQQACVKELSDPVKGIPGFGTELYNKLVDHATGTYGAPKDAVLSITAPWALKVLNDAMLYRQGLESAASKVQKVVNKATKVLRPGGSGNSEASTKATTMKALRVSGSQDDATEAFMASFAA